MKAFHTLFILSRNELNEFCVDREVMPNLEYAYRVGQDVVSHPDVYGYVIVKTDEDSWQIINETVYGVDYTVFEHNGRISVKEGRSKVVLIHN
jgi:hypothetical protein